MNASAPEVRPDARAFTFERDFSWCGKEPTFVFASPPEKLFYSVPVQQWFYEWSRDPLYHQPFRIRLDGGPQPFAATMLLYDLRRRLPEMPDALRALGIAAVVQLDAMIAHITSTQPITSPRL